MKGGAKEGVRVVCEGAFCTPPPLLDFLFHLPPRCTAEVRDVILVENVRRSGAGLANEGLAAATGCLNHVNSG